MALIRCCFEPPELPEFFDSFVQKCTDPSCKYNIILIFDNLLLATQNKNTTLAPNCNQILFC